MEEIEEAGTSNGLRGYSQAGWDKRRTNGREVERQNFPSNRRFTQQRGNRRRGRSRGGRGVSRPDASAGRGQRGKRGLNRGMGRGNVPRFGGLKMGPSMGSNSVSQERKTSNTRVPNHLSGSTRKIPNSKKREQQGLISGPKVPTVKQNSSKGRGGLKLGPHAPGKSGMSSQPAPLKHGETAVDEKNDEIYGRVEVPADSPYLDTRKYVKMSSDLHSELVSGFYTERGTGRRKREVEEDMPAPTEKWPGWPDVSYWSRLTVSPPESSSESSVQE